MVVSCDIVAELIAIKNVTMSVAEQERLVQDIIHDVLEEKHPDVAPLELVIRIRNGEWWQ